jgi:hypothetical protein
MILIGTVVMHVRPVPFGPAFGGLIASLAGTYWIRPESMAGLPFASRLGLSILFCGLPVFFASICFALIFRQRADGGTAFGWNMLGAVLGGLLELTSMAVGNKAMALFAIAAYAGALLTRIRRARGSEPVPAS